MNTIDRLEKRQNEINASIECVKVRDKNKIDKNNIKIQKLQAKNNAIETRQKEFIENQMLEFNKNMKLIYAEVEYAKNLGDKYIIKEKLRKEKVKRDKQVVEAIKKEAKAKGLVK
jgi:hypothetical protein